MMRVAAVVGGCLLNACILSLIDGPHIAPAEEPLPEYRRVFAPADRAQDWPFRPERYLPIPAKQFEQALQQAQQAASPPAETAVADSKLTVKFDGRDRLTGHCELVLRPVDAQARLIPLAAGSVPLVQAVWRETNTPAVVGNTPDGATAVWVERPGTLVCQWSAVGVRDAGGGVTFDVQSPLAAASSLILTLPPGHELKDNAAVKTSPAAKPATTTASPPTESVYEIRPLTPRRRLRIVSARAASAAAPRYALRQDTDYDYSERGVDLTTQLKIDAVDEPLSKLELEYDPGLVIVDARLPDRRLTWTDQEPPTSPRRTTIEFDPPLFGTNRTVLIRALAPAQVGKRHVLPTIRCPSLDWQQGTLSLAVATPLVIDRLDPTQCVAAVPTQLAGERTGEVVEFTCLDPKASLRVLANRIRDAAEATSVTTVAFGDDETKAEHCVELRVAAGERFLLQAAVPTRWIVDSVTASPSGVLADWTLSEVREKHRWLTIRLAQALKPDRPLRLTIVARAKRPGAGAALTADDLRIVEFRDTRDDAPIAAIRSADSWRLQLEREREEAAPTVERLDPLRRELLGEFVPEYLLDLRPSADPWNLLLTRRAARLEVQIAQTATLSGDQLTEKYQFTVVDQDAALVERLEVRFVPNRTQSISWSLGEERSGGLAARRTSTNDAKSLGGVETWEIVFPTPQVSPVELHAVRRSPFNGAAEIALAGVVDAVLGNGTVAVESDPATPLAVDRATLTPLPAAEQTDELQHRLRGYFRYEPNQHVVAGLARRLNVQRLTNFAELPVAVVWNARLQTAYEADGRITHRARLWIQSFGGQSFTWKFADGLERLAVHVDDEPLTITGTNAVVPLPKLGEFITVTAEYTERLAATGPLRLAAVTSLNLDLPVLHTERDLRLPPHYAAVDEAEAVTADDNAESRLQRLIAPLAKQGSRRSPTVVPSKIEPTDPLWGQGELNFDPGVPTSTDAVWLARRETTAAVQFAAAAIACALGLRYLVRRRAGFWLTLGVISALATVLPTYPAAILVWCCYGLVAAIAIEITLPKLLPRKSTRNDGRIGTMPTSTTGTAAGRAVVTSWPLLIAASLASSLSAQTPTTATPQPEPAAVFIPVGNDGRPNGERYQVPERLWKALEQRIAKNDPTSLGGAVLTGADYAIVVAHDARRAKHIISELRATWNVHVVAAPTEAAIPFTPFDVSSTAVLVDGRPVEAVRTSDGRRLRLAFDQPGPHRVEVIVRTATAEPSLGSGTALSIPRVNDGRLRVTMPPELGGLTIAEAAETPAVTADRRLLTTRLLPNDVLSLSWHDAATPSETVEFEQYEWWRVRPGTVTVDLKLRVVSPTAGGREITLLADPRLQWLPRRTGEGESIEVTSTPLIVEQATVGQRLRITLPESLRPDAVVETTFLLNGATGMGRLRLPELRLERSAARRHLFAVSIDPGLDFTFAGSIGFIPAAIPEFERMWGTTATLPQAAFELKALRDDWSLSTRPKATRLTAVETQTVTCGRRRVDVAYEAEITPTGDAITRYELAAPADLEVASVSVVDVSGDGEEHALRFARDDTGSVIVLLRTPLRSANKLTLRGRWSVPTAPDSTFPFVQLRGATGGSRQLRVIRLPEASVELVSAKNLQLEPPEATGSAVGQRGRLVGVWRVTAPNPTAKLKITTNAPRVAVEAVSTLRRDLQTWEYELVAQLDVTAGIVDEIRLDFPAAVALPLTIIPTMPYEATTLRENGRRQLVLHPRESIRGKFQFALRGDLTALDREHPVPHVRLRGVDSSVYYFQLPARTGLNRVAWDVEQLTPAPLPAGFSKPTAEDVVTYRALGPEPSATLREVRRGTGRPTVRLADHHIRKSSDGDECVSTWLVDPSGSSELTLRSTRKLQLLSVRAGGVDVVPTVVDDLAVRIPTASDQMPHLVEVAYRHLPLASKATDVAEFTAPVLEDLPIERTLWTIADTATDSPPVVQDAATAAQLQTQRAQVYTAVTAELTADQGLGETRAWIAPLERRRQRAAGVANAAGDAATTDLDVVWDAAADKIESRVYLSMTADKGTVVRSTAAPANVALRIWPAPLACLLAATLLWLGGRYDGLWRWSQLAAILVGLAWIVWLQPAIVGWILLAAVAGSRFHGSVRQARERRTTPIGAMRLAR